MLRTGNEYIASLRDGREVWLGGKRVDVTTDPRLEPCVEAIAGIYDLQHDPQYRDLLTMPSPLDGAPVSLAYLLPRSTADLLRRRRMIEFLMRRTGAVMGRLPEYMAAIVVGLCNVRPVVSQVDPRFGDNISAYLEHCREQDVCLSHSFADPPHNRARRPGPYQQLKVVGQTEAGITIRGAKAVATLAPYANEFIGLSPTRPEMQPDEVVYFATPIDAPGVKVICRPSLTQPSKQDHPLAASYDEMDAWIVFDDVFVPHERVFFSHAVAHNEAVFGEIPKTFAFYHILVRLAVKAEILAGMAAALADYFGTTGAPNVQSALFDLIDYLETLRAFVFAAEQQPVLSSAGIAVPNPTHTILGRIYGVERQPRILQIVRELCGSSLLMAPGEDDLAAPELSQDVARYVVGDDERALERFQLLKLAWDYTADSFGSRQLLFEMYNAATPAVNKTRILKSYDLTPLAELAKQLAGIPSTKSA